MLLLFGDGGGDGMDEMRCIHRALLAVAALSAFACSGEELESRQQTVFTTLEEIGGLTVRSDRLFEVYCNDGRAELLEAEDLWGDDVCENATGEGFFCTFNDGRGREPWAAARAHDGIVTLFPNVVYSELETCHAALARRLERGNDTYLCASRASDGLAPVAMFHVGDDAGTRLDDVAYRGFDRCFEASRASFESSERIFVCAPNDVDYTAPWRIHQLRGSEAERDGESYTSAESCYLGIREIADDEFTCVSRDNDGAAPYVLAQRIGVDFTRYEHAVYATTLECLEAASAPVDLGLGPLWICTSRDEDGDAPFALVERAVDSRPPRLVYGSLEECTDAASLAVRETDGSLVCASRDRDGIDPWSVFRVGSGSPEPTDLVFDTVDACYAAIR